MNKKVSNLKGILSDIDGTLYFKGTPVTGAMKTIETLRNRDIKLLFFTNTDSKSPKTVLEILQNYGFSINANEIFTPIIALKNFLSQYPDKKYYFVLTKEVKKEFQHFQQVNDSEIPDFVVIGDFHDDWDVHRLNNAFKYVLKGAKLLGTQGNKYYLDRNGEPVIDTGSFINMIAIAAKVTPKIFGKPSKDYFLQALQKIGLEANEVIAIGDDIDTDIKGANNVDIRGILVKTGKGQYFDLPKSNVKPYLIIESFSSILEII